MERYSRKRHPAGALPVSELFGDARTGAESPCFMQGPRVGHWCRYGQSLPVPAGAGTGRNCPGAFPYGLRSDVAPRRTAGHQRRLLYRASPETFDTLLLMMNGIGLVGTVNGFGRFFKQVNKLLKPGGQVLMDSSDLRYLYIDEDGSMLVNLNGRYYGEVEYRMSYGDYKGKRFKWLFIDDELMARYAEKHGFRFEKIADGPHFDYLARLVKL